MWILLNHKAMTSRLNKCFSVFITMGCQPEYYLQPCNSLPWLFEALKSVYWCMMLSITDPAKGVSEMDEGLIGELKWLIEVEAHKSVEIRQLNATWLTSKPSSRFRAVSNQRISRQLKNEEFISLIGQWMDIWARKYTYGQSFRDLVRRVLTGTGISTRSSLKSKAIE